MSCEIIVLKFFLVDGPVLDSVVEEVERDNFVLSYFFHDLFYFEDVVEFVAHVKHFVDLADEFLDVSEHEVAVIRLLKEEFEDFLSFEFEKPSDLFDSSEFSERI